MKTWILALLAAAATAWGVPAWAQKDESLLAAATAEQPAVVKTLERLVNIETGTGNAEGIAAMGDLLEAELKALGATVTRHKAAAPAIGDNIVGRIEGKGGKRLMLMAHMDTVYVKGTLAKAPFRIDGNRAFGPGIADDKSGLAVILHTLGLLKTRGDGRHVVLHHGLGDALRLALGHDGFGFDPEVFGDFEDASGQCPLQLVGRQSAAATKNQDPLSHSPHDPRQRAPRGSSDH